jgi:hypothetical protein
MNGKELIDLLRHDFTSATNSRCVVRGAVSRKPIEATGSSGGVLVDFEIAVGTPASRVYLMVTVNGGWGEGAKKLWVGDTVYLDCAISGHGGDLILKAHSIYYKVRNRDEVFDIREYNPRRRKEATG